MFTDDEPTTMELPQISRNNTSIVSRRTSMSVTPGRPTSKTGRPRTVDLSVAINVKHSSSRRQKRKQTAEKKLKFDPDADFSFDSTDEDETNMDSSEEEPDRGAIVYDRMCRKLGTVPVHTVSRQFGKVVISLENFNLGHRELKAFFVAALASYVSTGDTGVSKKEEEDEIKEKKELAQLQLGGNPIGPRELSYLSDFTMVHKPLVSVLLNSCQLTTRTVKQLADWVRRCKHLRKLDLSDNNLTDKDSPYIADILENSENLRELVLRSNKLGDSGERLGKALANNDTLTSLDLSWNHIRGSGAVGFALGMSNNHSLGTLILAWNGFGYEGCSALGHALVHNSTLTYLDLTCNRIHPPALFELIKGIERNKSLVALKLGLNPITASMTSILLSRLLKAKENSIKELDLEGVVVDKEFEGVIKEIQKTRLFMVRYDSSLPQNKGPVPVPDKKNIFNIDPVRILYFMKEHLRTIDLFLQIDKDCSNFLTRDEMKCAFEMEGFPISSSALDQVMGYLDINNDGEIDLLEFIEGERKLKRKMIMERQDKEMRRKNREQHFSQTFITNSKTPRTLPSVNSNKSSPRN